MFVDYSSDCDEKYPSVYACYSSVLKQSSAGKSDAEEKVKILKFFDNASSGICLIHFDEEDILKVEQGNRAFFEMDGISVISHMSPLFFKELQTKHQAANVQVHLMNNGKEQTFQISGMPFFFGKESIPKILLTCEKLRLVKRKKNAVYELLTKREKEIMLLVINGDKNSFIAHNLHITEGTVKKTLSNIYRKLSISSRTELIRLYLEYQNF